MHNIQGRVPLVGQRSDEGYAHKKNEDSYKVFKLKGHGSTQRLDDDLYVAIVADGVTSTSGGAQASKLAAEEIHAVLKKHGAGRLEASALSQAIDESILAANRKILDVAQANPQWGNMSTTLVMAVVSHGYLQIAHLGDSRAYLMRNQQLYRLTLDHTWVQEALDHGRTTEEELANNTNVHNIRRYLGTNQEIQIDREVVVPGSYHGGLAGRQIETAIELKADDVLLLCSDGLTDKVQEDEILDTLGNHAGRPQRAVDLLIKQALAKKEKDNITVVLLSYAKKQLLFLPTTQLGWLATAAALAGFAFIVAFGMLLSRGAEGSTEIVQSTATVTAVVQPTEATVPPTETVLPTVSPPAATPTTRLDDGSIALGATTTPPPNPTRPSGQQTPAATLPPPTSKPTVAPTPTPSPVPTDAPTATFAPDTTPSGANSIETRQAFLSNPQTSFATINLGQKITFSFETDYELAEDEEFEIVLWKVDQNVDQHDGWGITNLWENPPQNISSNLWELTLSLPDNFSQGSYYWGVWVVRLERPESVPPRLAYLGGLDTGEGLGVKSGGSGENSCGGNQGGCNE